MQDNKNLPAYPQPITADGIGNVTVSWDKHPGFAGLSKRELIAAMCLQGLLSNLVYNNPELKHKMVTVPDTAKTALDYADALLNKLQNTEQ